MKKILRPVAAAVLAGLFAATVATTLTGCATHRAPPGTAEIELVTLNDFHGNIEASKFTYSSIRNADARTISAGGIDTIGAALQAWRKQDPELLLVGAGDLIGASPSMSAMWADEPTIGAMNLLGLRTSSVGNHEFDQGRVELLRQQKGGCVSPRADKACKFEPAYDGAKFSYMAANVIDMTTRKPFLPAYTIQEAHGVKIGFIGVVLKDTASVVRAAGIAGLEFVDEADAVNRQLPELRKQGVGVFVVLIHQGGRTTDKFDQPDCANLTGDIVPVVKRLDPAIRLVVSGHSHKGYLCKVDGRLVTQSDMGGHVLGRIKLTVDTATNTLKDVSARQEIMTPGAWPADPAVTAYMEKIRAKSAAALARPVGKIAVPGVTRTKNEAGESALGDLVADSVLAAGRPFGVQIAFMNNGGMRQDLDSTHENQVTVAQAQATLPFGNTLVVMNLRGSQILDLLEQQWLGGHEDARGLLQVSDGFSYQWDARRMVGSRVVPDSVKVNGVPLDRDTSYRVMANAFLAEGGDSFPAFALGANRSDTGLRDVDALIDYLARRQLSGKPAGAAEPLTRIQRVQ